MTPNFRGNKEAGYAESRSQLQALSEQWGFELRTFDKGIYSPGDVLECVNYFERFKPDFLLLQTSSFSGGAFIEGLSGIAPRLGLWAVNEGEQKTGGLPLNSFCAMNMYSSILTNWLKHRQVKFKWFYGDAQGELFRPRFYHTIQALTALVNMQGARIGLVGGIAPGFDNLYFDERQLTLQTGMRVNRHLEFDEVTKRAASYGEKDITPIQALLRDESRGVDKRIEGSLDTAARVWLALKDMAGEYKLDAIALSCWPKFQTELNFAVCSVVGSLNAFGLPVACEGDVYSAASMLSLRYLSGQVTTLMDLVDLDFTTQEILLWHCGPAPYVLADNEGMTLKPLYLLEQTDAEGNIVHTGAMADMVLKPGAATIAAYTEDFSKSFVLEGVFNNNRPSFSGSRGWLRNLTLARQAVTVQDLVNTIIHSGFQHHYPVAYGHLAGSWLELSSWLGIEPINNKPIKPWLDWS